jgi:hypothetical protein
VRAVWWLVLVIAVAGLSASVVRVEPRGVALEGAGVFLAAPLGLVAIIALAGVRGRWDRALAALGGAAAVIALGAGMLLLAGSAVGGGVGSLLAAAAGQDARVASQALLTLATLAALVTALGCAIATIAGPRRPRAAAAPRRAATPTDEPAPPAR